MSPTAARKVAAAITFTPGTVNSRLASGESSICWATVGSTCSSSESGRSICLSADSSVSAFSTNSCCCSCSSQRRPLTPNMSEHGGLPCNLRIRTACTSFFARVAGAHQLLATMKPPAQHPHPLTGVHTASSSPRHTDRPACGSQACPSSPALVRSRCPQGTRPPPAGSGPPTAARPPRPRLRPPSRSGRSAERLSASAWIPSGAPDPASGSLPSRRSRSRRSRGARGADPSRPPDRSTCAQAAPSPRHITSPSVTPDGERVGERQRPIVRREAPCCIPGAAGRNSKGSSWVQWLTRI